MYFVTKKDFVDDVTTDLTLYTECSLGEGIKKTRQVFAEQMRECLLKNILGFTMKQAKHQSCLSSDFLSPIMQKSLNENIQVGQMDTQQPQNSIFKMITP